MKYTENDYKNKCKELNLNYIGNHKKVHYGTMIDFICNIHTDKGVQSSTWSHFKSAKKGCPYCTGRYKTNEEVSKELDKRNIILLSDYQGSENYITCKCKECSYIWKTKSRAILSNNSGCPKCGRKKANKSEAKTQDEFIHQLSLINPDIEVLGEYISTHKKIKCKCKKDNTIWYGVPANLLNSSAGCPTCSMSNSEKKMINILNNIGYSVISQYSFEDCKYKYKLKFDAYDKKHNVVFEYNGEQHYYPVDFAGKGAKWAENQLKINQIRDSIKIEYCKDHMIPMIIIPYWERNNMESFIIKELKKLGVQNQQKEDIRCEYI